MVKFFRTLFSSYIIQGTLLWSKNRMNIYLRNIIKGGIIISLNKKNLLQEYNNVP